MFSLFSSILLILSSCNIALAREIASSVNGDVCGSVLGSSQQLLATDVYDCLTSTPFKSDVARELLNYWKNTLKFHSTLAYLRDPPTSYQQPPIDLHRGLDLIRTQVDTGVFENHYAFEAAVQTLLHAAHDGAIMLQGSVLGVFVFGAPIRLVSVSSDGNAIPQVYVATDLSSPGPVSYVTKINGELAEDFLAVFASEHSFGFVEPHSDWNELMWSPAKGIQNHFGSFMETIFYPGDTFTIEFANGTVLGPLPWQAYNIRGQQKDKIQTGDDFYNYFVLGQLPTQGPAKRQATASATALVTASATAGLPQSFPTTGWSDPAYPTVADVFQDNLGKGGILTGYFLNDSKIGVLSIPSFKLTNEASMSFSSTVAQFLRRSKQAGMKYIVVDLQQNRGGSRLLATDTFRQFFPNIEPFSGMRSRSFQLADEIGNTYTGLLLNNISTLNDTFTRNLMASPFAVVANEINANTRTNFTSWGEYYGPNPDRGDEFSAVFQDDLSRFIFGGLRSNAIIDGLDDRSTGSPPPYEAADIAILTDGACSDACDMFVEMMHHEAGVRTVVVGGLPQYGPMQARGASRSAQSYSSDALDDDNVVACYYNQSLCSILPNRSSGVKDQSRMLLSFADQIRSKEYTPLQFVYEAADCRIYWTAQSSLDYTKLWGHAADAIFRNGSLCVPRSAEHNDTMRTNIWGPSMEQKASWASTNPAWVDKNNASISSMSTLAQTLYDSSSSSIAKRGFKSFDSTSIMNAFCDTDDDCGGVNTRWVCLKIRTSCPGHDSQVIMQCKESSLDGSNCESDLILWDSYTPAFCDLQGNTSPGCTLGHYCDYPSPTRDNEICSAVDKPASIPTAYKGDPGEIVR